MKHKKWLVGAAVSKKSVEVRVCAVYLRRD